MVTRFKLTENKLKKLVICIPVHGFSLALEKALISINRYIRVLCEEQKIDCLLLISNSGTDLVNIQNYWQGKYEIIKVPPDYYWGASVQSLFVLAQQHHPSHVLLMNHDVVLMENAWAELLTAMSNVSNTILSAVSIILNTEIVENAGFKYTNKSLPFLNLYLNEHINSLPKSSYQVDALNGRFVLFPANAANPDFLLPFLIPHYFADTVLSVRARRSGFSLTVIPTAIVCADRSDTESKKARERCDSITGTYNCLFKPYSYRYIWGNFWGQLLLVDSFTLGIVVSAKYTLLRIGKSLFELLRIIKPA
jgi:GT2 family glycosyltransferase